jgi:homoserine acetyltransferase
MLSYRTPYSFMEKFKRATVKAPRPVEVAVQQGSGRVRLNGTSSGNGSSSGSSSSSASSSASSSSSSGSSSVSAAPYWEVERYLNYQGEKFIKRFDPLCYVRLTQLLDSHDLGRNRSISSSSGASSGGSHIPVLRSLPQRTLVVGIDSDLLYPVDLQHELAHCIPKASMFVIRSPHGHDAFLIEIALLNNVLAKWQHKQPVPGLIAGSAASQDPPLPQDAAQAEAAAAAAAATASAAVVRRDAAAEAAQLARSTKARL